MMCLKYILEYLKFLKNNVDNKGLTKKNKARKPSKKHGSTPKINRRKVEEKNG